MLDFYLADEGRIPESPEGLPFVGSLSMDQCRWLKKFGFIQEQTFDFFDSSWISPEAVRAAIGVLIQREDACRRVPGFDVSAVDALKKMLARAVENGSGLVTDAD